MKLFDKKSLILLISVVSINLLCIVSVSYAYFTANIKGNEDAQEMKVQAGTMEITYTDSNEVSLNNALPGDSVTKTFKIENTGTLKTKYNIKIDVNTNDFEDYSDLTYSLTKNSESKLSNQILPYEDGYIIKDEEIEEKGIDNYTLTLTFKKDDSNQNDNANKKVDFTIEVDSKDDIKLYEYKEPYKDNSGANRPKLYQGLIPITFNDDNTMKIADITSEWYNYEDNKWGNAVLIDNTNQDIVNKFYNEDGTLKINQTITENDILQMYVWIPRYKYQLFNAVNGESAPKQIINIEFEKGVTSTGNVSCKYINEGNGTITEDCQNAINGNWYTHPAFTFGDTELSGIWIGKFEASDPTDENGRTNANEINEIKIIPNKTSMVNRKISTMFNAVRDIELENAEKYNLNQSAIDTHLPRNAEWGAIAYLSQSIYGIYKDESNCNISEMSLDDCKVWINNSAQGAAYSNVNYNCGGTYTGCVGDSASAETNWNNDDNSIAKCDINNRWNTGGVKASTTGNMYGVYDMAGGAWEYVMGAMLEKGGANLNLGSSGFQITDSKQLNFLPEAKYYDVYTYDTTGGSHYRGHLGDANRETLMTFGNTSAGWNSNTEILPTSATWCWIVRGGYYIGGAANGVFTSHQAPGGMGVQYSFRSVLTAA